MPSTNHLLKIIIEGSSKTHSCAEKYKKRRQLLQNRQKTSVKNQLRFPIGVVHTKHAIIHYEIRVAELYKVGIEVGDFGHSHVSTNDRYCLLFHRILLDVH